MKHLTSQAPATAAEFKRAITTGFRRENPEASIVFTTRVRRFRGRDNQPVGTVSFAVEFLARSRNGRMERFIGTSFRLGGIDGNRRVGSGYVEASRQGTRSVWS